MNDEKWYNIIGFRDVVDYDYEVSNKGNVRKGSKMLAVNLCKRGGYPSVSLYSRLTQKTRFVTIHSLMKRYIFGVDDPNVFINHKDGVVTNRDISNMELSNALHNTHHAIDTGLLKASKLTDDIVDSVRDFVLCNPNVFTMIDLAEMHSISSASVKRILNGTYRKGAVNMTNIEHLLDNPNKVSSAKETLIKAALEEGHTITHIRNTYKCDYYTVIRVRETLK